MIRTTFTALALGAFALAVPAQAEASTSSVPAGISASKYVNAVSTVESAIASNGIANGSEEFRIQHRGISGLRGWVSLDNGDSLVVEMTDSGTLRNVYTR